MVEADPTDYRVQRALEELGADTGVRVLPLYGELEGAAQHPDRDLARGCGAVADALRVPAEGCKLESLDAESGAAIVSATGKRFRVQTARLKEAVVATTLCEGV